MKSNMQPLFTSIGNVLQASSSKGSEIAKGMILGCWYISLIFAVSVAYKGMASNCISKLYDIVSFNKESMSPDNEEKPIITSALDYLYFEYKGEVPSNILVIFLNSVIPRWSDKELFGSDCIEDGHLRIDIQNKYFILFVTADAFLRAAIDNTSFDVAKNIRMSECLPRDFYKSIDGNDEVSIPTVIQNWIVKERESNSINKAKLRLADTFIILIILGTFGSLIFLTKDYISNSDIKDTNIAAYIFRPLFGMALAVAMFIVDMVVHSVISTGGVENIRNETMYLLGLSSGLLAEKAYEILRQRANAGLQTEDIDHQNK